jgi:hypothetical protein
MTTGGCLGVDGEGVAPHWRITECPTFDAKGTYIAATRKESSKRIPKGHIDLAASMYPKGAHNCLPLPSPLMFQRAARVYPELVSSHSYAGYSSLPIELRLLALGLTRAASEARPKVAP